MLFRSGGAVRDLGTLGAGTLSAAQGINDAGTIVGYSWLGATQEPTHAFSWNLLNGLRDLSPAYDNADGRAINSNGAVVGGARSHAFVWTVANGLQGVDNGACQNSDATAINDDGLIAGMCLNGDSTRAVVWNHGNMTDLGTIDGANSYALGINAGGDVVGKLSDTRAFLYRNGVMHDLYASIVEPGDWVFLSLATDINDRGQIVGWGYRRSPSGSIDGAHGFLLEPVDDPPADDIAPVLTAPPIVKVDASTPKGAVVRYSVSAADQFDPAPSVSCSPVSARLFPIGTTTVSCVAIDRSGNRSVVTFPVVVRGAPAQLASLREAIQTFKLKPAVDVALRAPLVLAEAAAKAGHPRTACSLLAVFAQEVRRLPSTKLSRDRATDLLGTSARIRSVLGCA